MKHDILTVAGIKQAYRNQEYTVRELWQEIKKRAQDAAHMNIWIHMLSDEEIEKYFVRLEADEDKNLPLWGIPFAIKDNIDLEGIPTTAACAEYSYIPEKNAYVVEQLIEAGAFPVGKTNMDQFATGLVGTRSPYGEVHNAYNEAYISGGSSSGSAVAVALGLAAFSLGTDTAGSGRVPASLNNLVGWKPSVGAWSNRGVVPACESIDCVTVFTNTVDDAELIDKIARKQDREYRYSKDVPEVKEIDADTIYLPAEEPEFYGDHAKAYKAQWNRLVSYLKSNYDNVVPLDTTALSEAALILYEGPWVAERYAGLKDYLDNSSETLFPVTKEIICGAMEKNLSAVLLFQAMHRLADIKNDTHKTLKNSVLVMPTNGGTFTREQVDADPIRTNSKMGLYTNHCNLLDLCAINVPIGFAAENLPMGITVFSNSGQEGIVAKIGRELSAKMTEKRVSIAVCGLHMKGFLLDSQLVDLGGRYEYTTETSSDYRLYELNMEPSKPGLIKAKDGGQEQEIEVWSIPEKNIGTFLEMIPSPLGLGKITTKDGENMIGFICEGYAVEEAKNITKYGGWRYKKTS